MSTVKTNNVQIGQSVTATNNFTWYQPATPDGTVRLGNGNSGSVTDLVTLTSAGRVGIGGTPSAGQAFLNGAQITGATASYANVTNGTVQLGVTGSAHGYATSISTAASAFTLSNLIHFRSIQATLGAGSSVTNQFGFYADASLTGATNNYGFYSNIASGTGRYNFYAAGTADNYFAGNLGLGVTPNTWSVGKAMQIGTTGALVADNVGSMYWVNNAYYNGGWKYTTSNVAAYYVQNGNLHQWHTAPSGTAGNAISFTQAMTLDASGRLYVKQTSQSGNTAQRVGVTFDGSSEWGINVTTSSNSGNAVNFTNASGTQIGQIQVSSTATAYVTSSDQRLKTNVTPAGSAIQSILDFPVEQFDWISSGEHQDFGAVAQKAINVIPEMVTVPANENEMWGIDWSKAVPRLIKTIQELSAELNELKQKVNA